MQSTDATLLSARSAPASYASTGSASASAQRERPSLLDWRFWLPALFLLLIIVVPDFEVRHAQSAGGVEVESDLIATMATENSLRERVFLLALLTFGGGGLLLGMWAGVVRGKHGSAHLWLIVATLAYACISLTWSDLPAWTFRRLVITALFTAGSWGIGRAWRPMQLVYVTLFLSTFIAISGIFAEIYYGTFMESGDWRFSGLLHPNRQALSCGLLAMAAVAMKIKTGKRLYWLLAAVAVGLLVMTGSRGGLVACVLAVASQIFMSAPKSQRIVWGLLACAPLVAGMLFLALEPNGSRRLESIAKMGRSDAMADPQSLTGRIPIWGEMITGIRERAALGYGYAAYWTPERIRRMSYIHDWEFNNSHSSYLEMLLSLGTVGFTLGMTGILTIWARGFSLLKAGAEPGLIFILAVFVMAFVNGLIESIFVSVGYEYLVWLIGAFMIIYYPHKPTRARLSSEAAKRPSPLGAPLA